MDPKGIHPILIRRWGVFNTRMGFLCLRQAPQSSRRSPQCMQRWSKWCCDNSEKMSWCVDKNWGKNGMDPQNWRWCQIWRFVLLSCFSHTISCLYWGTWPAMRHPGRICSWVSNVSADGYYWCLTKRDLPKIFIYIYIRYIYISYIYHIYIYISYIYTYHIIYILLIYIIYTIYIYTTHTYIFHI